MLSESTSWGDRLKSIRKKANLDQEQFAKKLHISRSYLSQLETGGREVQPWFQEKIIEMEIKGVSSVNITALPAGLKGNASEPKKLTEVAPVSVPVISWAAAGSGSAYYDLAEQINEWVMCDTQDPNSYALIIEGDSMEPQFLAGDRVIFLPNQEPRNGDVVVARLEETGQVYFKLFHLVGPKADIVRLTSYNTIYPPLEFPRRAFRFIHPMHSMWRKRRG